jgi:hypothetical protein
MLQAGPKSAFVIMPFDQEFITAYDDVMAPGVRAAGLAPVRADQEVLGSGANPNVF